MAKAELRHVAQGQASIVPPLSSRLLCRRLWRGQLPPDTFGLLKAIRWCGCHHASCAVSTPSTNALASDSLSAGGPLGLLGGFGVPIFACSHGQRFSTNSRKSTINKGEPEDLVEFLCQKLSSLPLAMPSIQPADKIECSRNARHANLKALTIS